MIFFFNLSHIHLTKYCIVKFYFLNETFLAIWIKFVLFFLIQLQIIFFFNFRNIWTFQMWSVLFFYCLSYWCWGIQVSKCFSYVTYCHKILQFWSEEKIGVMLLSIFCFGIFVFWHCGYHISKDMNWHLSSLCQTNKNILRTKVRKVFLTQ